MASLYRDGEKLHTFGTGGAASSNMTNLSVDHTTNEILITRDNGTVERYNISAYIEYIISSIELAEPIYCDKKPTITSNTTTDTDGNTVTTHTVTYIKDGTSYTTNPTNIWFYYGVTNDAGDINIHQTIFVDGVELTIKAGQISDIISMDPDTKNWILYGEDTGVCSEAKSPTITENENNSDINYRLDITDAEGNVTTTPNLKGNDGVTVPLNGFCYIHIVDGNLVLDCEAGATPLPLSLEGDKLYYTLGGEIQYVSKETIITD